LRLRNLHTARSEIEIVADQIRVPGVLDAQHYKEVLFFGHRRKLGHPLFAEWRMLAIDPDKVVRPVLEDGCEPIPGDVHRHAHPYHAFTVMDLSLQSDCSFEHRWSSRDSGRAGRLSRTTPRVVPARNRMSAGQLRRAVEVAQAPLPFQRVLEPE